MVPPRDNDTVIYSDLTFLSTSTLPLLGTMALWLKYYILVWLTQLILDCIKPAY